MTEWAVVLYSLMAPALCVVAVHFGFIHKISKERGKTFTLAQRLLMAFFSAVISVVVGGTVGFAVWMGPAYIMNDFIGTPWLTMLPAMGLACLSWLGAAQVSASLLVGTETVRQRDMSARYIDW